MGLLAHACELIDRPEDLSAGELAKEFSWKKLRKEDIYLDISPILQK